MDEKEYYKYSSGVNIDSVYEEYDKERAVGYDGEFALFRYLMNNNHFEHCKILTNLIIPVGNTSKRTEIDMLMITEQGIIVFEVKNYKGTIYGSLEDTHWTQYFRTAKNNRFRNPIKQNEYHLTALKELCPVKTHSIIFFSNNDCDIRRVTINRSEYSVTDRVSLPYALDEVSRTQKTLSIREVDELFDKLRPFTKETEPIVLFQNDECKNVNDFKNKIVSYADEKIAFWRSKYSRVAMIVCIVVAVFAFCIVGYFVQYADKAEREREQALVLYNEMYSKFSEVSIEDIELTQSILSISDLSITPHEYLSGSYLRFRITNNTNNAKILFQYPGRKIYSEVLVQYTDGSVESYEIENSDLHYNTVWGPRSKMFEFIISRGESEIKSIKIQPVYLYIGSEVTHTFAINLFAKTE